MQTSLPKCPYVGRRAGDVPTFWSLRRFRGTSNVGTSAGGRATSRHSGKRRRFRAPRSAVPRFFRGPSQRADGTTFSQKLPAIHKPGGGGGQERRRQHASKSFRRSDIFLSDRRPYGRRTDIEKWRGRDPTVRHFAADPRSDILPGTRVPEVRRSDKSDVTTSGKGCAGGPTVRHSAVFSGVPQKVSTSARLKKCRYVGQMLESSNKCRCVGQMAQNVGKGPTVRHLFRASAERRHVGPIGAQSG